MQVQVVNEHARQRYGAFVGALDVATESLQASAKVIARMRESKQQVPGNWRACTPDELRQMLNKAFRELEKLKSHAKLYEAELVSRAWRV
ncbi:hypothetical protein GCM10012275_49070 [Longimycelium tulufanense]|uniref:Uncharacterized protein n=1 Tax=Longimycelium tulufanense TaxID=907463 RepID=A0A8J3CC79_9PSEU|nr:hypothetical protein [Longimycelium tulufanense]GGM72638.1 hypothetical protein GCM10012275_49070 [Longimycelium tulufanense]